MVSKENGVMMLLEMRRPDWYTAGRETRSHHNLPGTPRMPSLTWQIVTHWIGPNSSEHVQTVAFDTYDEARREIQRLAPAVGTVTQGKMLKAVQIIGDYKSAWPQSP
jgi:hypothetical protein